MKLEELGDDSGTPRVRSILRSRVQRYARSSDQERWLVAKSEGVVEAILNSAENRTDAIVIAWPCPPDNGFVATALALREARTTGRLERLTTGLWPWRWGASYAARMVLLHPQDVAEVAAGCAGRPRDAGSLSEALMMLELRLNDLVRRDKETNSVAVSTPTLLETTVVFPPTENLSGAAYKRDADQILKRVRTQTHIMDQGSTIAQHLELLGDPRNTPFAVFGLVPRGVEQLRHCLTFDRFAELGLDVVVADLTVNARRNLGFDWEGPFQQMLDCLRSSEVASETSVVALCDDAYTLKTARKKLSRRAPYPEKRPVPSQRGMVLLKPGLLVDPAESRTPIDRKDVVFEADVKDASLVPLRRKLVSLVRRLRESGNFDGAAAVRAGLRALSAFASLPLGVKEAQDIARVIFDGDGLEETRARSQFFPTAAFQVMAEAGRLAPNFEFDVRALCEEVNIRVQQWESATPVSAKLARILDARAWNAEDVLLVLPDSATADVYTVSDSGIACDCTIVHRRQLSELIAAQRWRRLAIIRPDPATAHTIVAMPAAPERVLFLADGAGTGVLRAAVSPLASVPEFAPFARRIRALSEALTRGGADETYATAELEIRERDYDRERVVDLSQSGGSCYSGDLIEFSVESGRRVVYRKKGEVLVFAASDVRPFRKKGAASVQPGDAILVLHKRIRDRLAEELKRSKGTTGLLKQYHDKIAACRRGIPGRKLRDKALHVLQLMREVHPEIGEHEVPNIIRWLDVGRRDTGETQPRAARDHRRFRLFTDALEIDSTVADAFWNVAIVPQRTYSIREGYQFNRRVVQFILDPEGVAPGAAYSGALWQQIVDSVETVTGKEIRRA